MKILNKQIKKSKYQFIINSLRNSSPEGLIRFSEKKAIQKFNTCSKAISPYKKLLNKSLIEGTNITDIESFKKTVPITHKDLIFSQEASEFIFSREKLDNIQNILLSSGTSGAFSFGVISQKHQKKNAQFLDILLNYFFKTLDHKSLIVNCLSQAVKLPEVRSSTIIEIGPRTDSLIYILRNLSNKFEQTIIIGDNYFVKNSLEDARDEKIDFSKIKIHLIIGGIYLPENLRSHLEKILNPDWDNNKTGLILSSMGISEFGLNIFFESQETVHLRKYVKNNIEVQNKLLEGDGYPFLPMFFNYFPQAFFVEEIKNKILITDLGDSTKFSLIRYNSQDNGKIIKYKDLRGILNGQGNENLMPPFKSPLVLIYGREKFVNHKGTKIYPAQVQEGIFSNPEIASSTTGNFRLSTHSRYKVRLEIQLKKGLKLTRHIKKLFLHNIYTNIKTVIPVKFFPYQDFPYGMELDYERKFKFTE